MENNRDADLTRKRRRFCRSSVGPSDGMWRIHCWILVGLFAFPAVLRNNVFVESFVTKGFSPTDTRGFHPLLDSTIHGQRRSLSRSRSKTSTRFDRSKASTCLLGGSSLVAANDVWGNLGVLSTVSVAAQSLGNSTKIGRLLGAPVTAMALTFGLASIGILPPGGTATSRSLQKLTIQLATPWILLGADFGGRPKNTTTTSVIPIVIGFGLASLATFIGGTIGFWVAGPSLVASSLGPHHGLAIAAALLAKNIGSGINYVAVCAALQASPEAIAAGLCIDNIGALVYFPISNLLASRYPEDVGIACDNDAPNKKTPAPMTVASISIAFFAATVLLWCGDAIAKGLLKSPSSQIPIVTLLSVILAGVVAPRLPQRRTVPFLSSLWKGIDPGNFKATCDTLGMVSLYLFFTTAGAPGIQVAESMKSALLPLSIFSIILYFVHGGTLSAAYQLFHSTSRFRKSFMIRTKPNETTSSSSPSWKWEDVFAPQRLLVASSSAIGGPPTSVALAQSMKWDSLVVQALLVGNIGYAISTFLGIAFYYAFKPTVLG